MKHGPFHRVSLSVTVEGPEATMRALLDPGAINIVIRCRQDWSDFSFKRLDPIPDGLSAMDYVLSRYGRLCAALLFEPPNSGLLLLPRDLYYTAALEDLMDHGDSQPRTAAECRDTLLHLAPAGMLNHQESFDPREVGRRYLDNRARFGCGTREEWAEAHWGALLEEEWIEVEVAAMADCGLSLSARLEADAYFPVRFFERLAARHPDLRIVVNFTAEDQNEATERELTWEHPATALAAAPARRYRSAGLGS